MTIDRATIEKKVREIIVDSIGVDPEMITDDSSFVDDLGADSLSTTELVMAFEEEFGIEIPDEDADQLQTVGAAITYLEKNIGD
jgi:acyl carrier protein